MNNNKTFEGGILTAKDKQNSSFVGFLGLQQVRGVTKFERLEHQNTDTGVVMLRMRTREQLWSKRIPENEENSSITYACMCVSLFYHGL